MPRDPSIGSVLVVGSGPIVIGQAAEFDYAGTQAVKVLRREGVRVILVNSNPATIMTDPELADRTYIEPLTRQFVEPILERERPDALLPTVGGQTGLNLAVELAESGVLDRYGVRLIGARLEAVKLAEDRQLFKQAMIDAGLDVPRSGYAGSVEEARELVEEIGYPAILRPSFTLGGTGGGVAYNLDEYVELVRRALFQSPVNRVLVEESLLGWKEFELEVMRDGASNFTVICSIENVDPMGVHTGDSITVAPAQTLTDVEYQQMRDWARRVIDAVGVETGGSNIQFAVEPSTGRMVVIEMNPRVSRSSALASKATGFPIAKIAAKVALGYRLDEIENDITRTTPASFEPTIDYVVVKMPRWNFKKFPQADPTLGIQMKSVGEVMALGSNFREALLKALRSLERTDEGVGVLMGEPEDPQGLRRKLRVPTPDRLGQLFQALSQGLTVKEIHRLTHIDPWFLEQLLIIVNLKNRLASGEVERLLPEAKACGFSDRQIARLANSSEESIRKKRKELGIHPSFKRVDTCAAEFVSYTPYLYSTYGVESEVEPGGRRKLMILGSGPNRIGQGIEFDYCCCQAAYTLHEAGIESIMVNCNPETVSTDYDTSDRLYFEPLTLENVLNIFDTEKPTGVIVQFGGQTPLTLALPLKAYNVPIIGTDPESIDLAENRELFGKLLAELDIPQPENGIATNPEEACAVARKLGYPVLVRPSYVLGGRAMVIAYDQSTVESYMREAVVYSQERPVLIDRFLENAIEIDVDALCDQTGEVLIGGIMEHIEEAGVHSGDSSCVLPAATLSAEHLQTIRDYTVRMARALRVVGLMNVQYAIANGKVYVIEVNPRASRTVPYVSKATGVPLAKIAVGLMVGRKLADYNLPQGVLPVDRNCVKSPVFPFNKFLGVDPILGPEMRSTGEVMGIGETFGEAFAKAQLSAGQSLPDSGAAFISVNDRQRAEGVEIARKFATLGFSIYATRGTAQSLRAVGIECRTVFKVNEGRPNLVDLIKDKQVDIIINTPAGAHAFHDEKAIRRAAAHHRIPCITTLSAARAAADGIAARRSQPATVRSLQELHAKETVS